MVPKSVKYLEHRPNDIFITLSHKGIVVAYAYINAGKGVIKSIFYREKNKAELSETIHNWLNNHDFVFTEKTKTFTFKYHEHPKELTKLLLNTK